MPQKVPWSAQRRTTSSWKAVRFFSCASIPNTGGFNKKTGKLVGTMNDSTGKPIKIDQLWGIEFGGGTSSNGSKTQLFFAAGPKNFKQGLFGVINFK